MIFKKFEDMEVWKAGRTLVKNIYAMTANDLFAHDWGLKDQMQRAVVSICSNIAEGYARRGNKEFLKYLWIAKGSAAEVQSQLYHALDIGYVSKETFESLYGDLSKIQVMLYRLIQSLSIDTDRQKL